jgi:uncharacterized membrane protein
MIAAIRSNLQGSKCKAMDKGMNLRKLAIGTLALVFAGVGLAHFIALEGFERFLPNWMPYRGFWVISTGILEVGLAVGLMVERTRRWAGILAIALLLMYTPLHVVDVLRDTPVIGPKPVAIARLPLQLVFLYMAWLGTQGEKKS